MEKNQIIAVIRQKYQTLQCRLNERTRRLWAATEAHALGRGGISIVHQAIGMDLKTIRRGLNEMNSPEVRKLSVNRSRVPGGGRKNLTEHYSELPQVLDALIDPVMRGDPESPLRWTCKSTRLLANELNRQGYEIGPTRVRFLLHEMEYSLQGNQKTREGEDHPDRNDQFLYINDHVKRFLHSGQPVISVDTKKKQCCCDKGLGNYSNQGREWHPKGTPIETNMHTPQTANTVPTKNSAKRFLTESMTLGVTKVG